MGPGVGYDGEKLPEVALRSVLGAEIEPAIEPDRSCVKSRLILRPAWIGPAGATLDARRWWLAPWWPPLGPLWEPRGRMCMLGRFCVRVGMFRLDEKLGDGVVWFGTPGEVVLGICSVGIPPEGVKPASSELSKSRLSCMFCARMYCCSLVRYVSSISSYIDSSCTISRVMCRALPVRCLCRLEARLADSMRASKLRSLRLEAAMNALWAVSRVTYWAHACRDRHTVPGSPPWCGCSPQHQSPVWAKGVWETFAVSDYQNTQKYKTKR